MPNTSKKYIVILALGIILTVAALIWTKPTQKAELEDTPPLQVVVTNIVRRDVTPVETVTGRLDAAQKSVLHFELAGQLAERHVEPGQRVRAGQELLSLAEGDFHDALLDAQAQLQQQRAAIIRDRQLLELARREQALQAKAVARFDELGKTSLTSKVSRDEAEARLLQLQTETERLRYNVDTAQASLQQREAGVSRAQRNLERARLKAPFDGIVNVVHVQAGDYVTPNVPAVELVGTDRLDLYVEVPAAAAAALKLGERLPVRAEGESREAEVVALQTEPDPATHTYALRLRVKGEGWLPGQLAQTDLTLATVKGALVVPVTAVLQEEDAVYVFVVEQGVLRRTLVTSGPRMNDSQVITTGLQGNETLVARDVAALADGERVIVQ